MQMDAPSVSVAGALERPPVGRMFLRWYFTQRPSEILHAYRAYAAAFMETFSFVFLLKTLLSPWKNIKDAYPSKGFNVGAIFETLTLNLTARVIGSVVRIIAIVVGIAMQLLLMIGFVAYAILWIIFPPLLLIGVPALFVLAF